MPYRHPEPPRPQTRAATSPAPLWAELLALVPIFGFALLIAGL